MDGQRRRFRRRSFRLSISEGKQVDRRWPTGLRDRTTPRGLFFPGLSGRGPNIPLPRYNPLRSTFMDSDVGLGGGYGDEDFVTTMSLFSHVRGVGVEILKLSLWNGPTSLYGILSVENYRRVSWSKINIVSDSFKFWFYWKSLSSPTPLYVDHLDISNLYIRFNMSSIKRLLLDQNFYYHPPREDDCLEDPYGSLSISVSLGTGLVTVESHWHPYWFRHWGLRWGLCLIFRCMISPILHLSCLWMLVY